MTNVKPFLLSKIVWLNLVATAIAVLQLLPALIEAGELSAAALIGLLVAVANIILRIWFTSQPVTKPLGLGDPK